MSNPVNAIGAGYPNRDELGGTMSEEQVMPQDEENHEDAATYWIDMLTPKTAANYRAAAIQCDGNYRRANAELLTTLASLAQSEAERERLQGENIKLLNDASVWRNRAIGAEEELREGGRGIDLRGGFER